MADKEMLTRHKLSEVDELISPHWPRRPGEAKVNIQDAWPFIEAGEGWADVLYHAHHIAKDYNEHYVVRQIKEKFGGLRFYADLPLHVEIMIENLAKNVCEICGDFGVVVAKAKTGWLTCLCKDHTPEGHKPIWTWDDKNE